MITLYEFLKVTEKDFDTYDTEFDEVVTVCYIADEDVNDEYDKFCTNIIKSVNVVKQCGEYSLIVNWNDLIKRNLDKFKKVTKEHWNKQYENDIDEFIYQWIKEIHYYLAGYVSEDTYKDLNEILKELE